jgi:hypothetical protein
MPSRRRIHRRGVSGQRLSAHGTRSSSPPREHSDARRDEETGADDGGDHAPPDTMRLLDNWPRRDWPRHDRQGRGPVDRCSARIQLQRVERYLSRRRSDVDIETEGLDGEMRQRASSPGSCRAVTRHSPALSGLCANDVDARRDADRYSRHRLRALVRHSEIQRRGAAGWNELRHGHHVRRDAARRSEGGDDAGCE